MNGINPQAGGPAAAQEIYYPSSDGKPMAETDVHVRVMGTLIATLQRHYRQRSDVYVSGNIFLYYQEGHLEARRSPDVMVVKGVEPRDRRSFKTWEERAIPCLIIEVTSAETAAEDQGPKRELYQQLGVREYFLFDPLHEYLERPLLGYRLIGDEYELLQPANDGGVLSAELGMRLVPEEKSLGLFSFRTGERIFSPTGAYELLEEARQKADRAEERTQQLEQQLQQEQQRIDQLAAELARLRAPLPPEGEAGPPKP
jgi:Uma2 family endonuclease